MTQSFTILHTTATETYGIYFWYDLNFPIILTQAFKRETFEVAFLTTVPRAEPNNYSFF
jgi:hypothetical protein